MLCTGNPKDIGIAMEIEKIFPDTIFVSRTSGYDLSTAEGLSKLRTLLRSNNILINNAYVFPGTQEKILLMAREEWQSGHIFNIGSIDEYTKWGWAHPDSAKEKIKLKEVGLNLTDENFKVTHITVGGFKSSTKPHSMPNMDPKHIASTIKWALEAEFQIPVIGVEQITDYIRGYFEMKRNGIL